jgi:hypothetical protein
MISFWRFIGRACVDPKLRSQFKALYEENDKEGKIWPGGVWKMANRLGLRPSLFETWEIARLIDDKKTLKAMETIGSALPKDYLPSFTIGELYEAIGICSLDIEFAKQMHTPAAAAKPGKLSGDLRGLLFGYGINLCDNDLAAFQALIADEDAMTAIKFINDNDWDFPCDEARFFSLKYADNHWYGDPFVGGFLYADKLKEFREAARAEYQRIVKKTPEDH